MPRSFFTLLHDRSASLALWFVLIGYGFLWGFISPSHTPWFVAGFSLCCPPFNAQGRTHPRMFYDLIAINDGAGLRLIERFEGQRTVASGTPLPPVIYEVALACMQDTGGLFAPSVRITNVFKNVAPPGPATPGQTADLNAATIAFIKSSGGFHPDEAIPVYTEMVARGDRTRFTIQPWYLVLDLIAMLFVIAACAAPVTATRDFIIQFRDLRARERRRSRLAAGKCPRCLYDIRGTPDLAHCPECNEPIAAAPAPPMFRPPALDTSVPAKALSRDNDLGED